MYHFICPCKIKTLRISNYFSTHHYIYFVSHLYFMSILTQVSCFIWSFRMPKFSDFLKILHPLTELYSDCLSNSISGRGKVNWKKFYQHIIVLFHLFQHRELKNCWILNQMICQVCKSSYFNYFSWSHNASVKVLFYN